MVRENDWYLLLTMPSNWIKKKDPCHFVTQNVRFDHERENAWIEKMHGLTFLKLLDEDYQCKRRVLSMNIYLTTSITPR